MKEGIYKMTHEMKLQPKHYQYILTGTKRIEIRLNDEKRQLIKIEDIIKFFKEPEWIESFEAKVVQLLKYNSFDDILKDFNISVLSDNSMTKEELKKDFEMFYTKEKQDKYGILAIRIELL